MLSVESMCESALRRKKADAHQREKDAIMQYDQDTIQPVLLMTARQVARALGISRSMVYLIIQRGELRCIHIGRAMRISRSEVRRSINERENAQQSPTRSRAKSQNWQARKA